MKPEVWDNWDADETARFMQEVNMVPVALQAKEEDVARVREERQAQQEAEQQAAQAQVMSDAYSKTTNAPEAGSGAEAMIEGME